ncbi:MAG: peptide-methionine (S)-S-oxide reductase MsrA [Actinomycetaceae bacterium]|nr:peptide-methionine (S)-S-oxide reductase MsrA [Arcanobacterium sp.]MDD7505847.1 peptide-methionine (S)-S-oxide reductase MsrA [Actinomycetaceae bacterium]MDY6143769.1 peptide-methionine (S)-S-oxide reductase MsrA [Arcanobacterium sp.]
MNFSFFPAPTMVSPEEALPGRKDPVLPHPHPHTVLGTDILAEPKGGEEVIYLAGGCYWGVEEIYWQTPGVVATAVGFMGGYTPNPTYREVTTGRTGHTETVRVVYDPAKLSTPEVIKTFMEMHDPTSLNRQGNDIGTQYRSAIFTTTPQQLETAQQMANAYEEKLAELGRGKIVTEIKRVDEAGAFYPAEDEHQQYLDKNPYGYRCHSASGISCPMPGTGPLADL